MRVPDLYSNMTNVRLLQGRLGLTPHPVSIKYFWASHGEVGRRFESRKMPPRSEI